MTKKPAKTVHLDLDAAIGEAQRENLVVRFGGVDYELPPELPADVLLPLIDPELDLIGTIKTFIDDDTEGGTDVVDALLSRPDLPAGVWDAFTTSLRRLFGDDQFDTLEASRPSIPAYVRLVGGLFRLYGVGLGEALGPSPTSEDGGGSSKETSSTTTG